MVKEINIACAGYEVSADLYENKASDKFILFLYGATSTKARQVELATFLHNNNGASVLVFDYSGHGESPFELRDARPAQHFLEVISVFDWIKDNYPKSEIWVVSASYGGFLATQLTKYRKFSKLVLRCPAIYKPEDFYDLWAKRLDNSESYKREIADFRSNSVELAEHPLLNRADNFDGKVLVVVHEKDELIPTETTDAYIKAFNADAYIASGFTHAVSQSPVTAIQIDEYQKAISDWLSNSLNI